MRLDNKLNSVGDQSEKSPYKAKLKESEYTSHYRLQLEKEFGKEYTKEITKECEISGEIKNYFCRVLLVAIQTVKDIYLNTNKSKDSIEKNRMILVESIKTFFDDKTKKNWSTILAGSENAEATENELANELKGFLLRQKYL